MADPIRLTDAARFSAGGVEVTPAARTLAGAAGECVLEPRVMQVLVTLHRQCGEVVGREALIDACWEGRAVGDDSINRAILKLRRALDEVGGNLIVQTVAKVGYCLRVHANVLEPASAPASGHRHWRWLLVGAALLVLSAVGGWLVVSSHEQYGQTRIITVQTLRVSAGDDPAARRLAQDFASDLSRAVLGHDGRLQFAEAEAGPDRAPSFTLRGSVASIAGDLHAVVTISDRDNPAILWSHDFTAPIDKAMALREQVSTNVAAVLVCAIGTRGLPDRIGTRAIALYLESCNLHAGDHWRETYLLRQIIAQAPSFADAWANLAISLALASEEAEPAEAASMRHEAAVAAQHAQQLDPHCGNAYYARALLLPGTGNWVTRDRIIRAGLEAAPEDPQLYNHLGEDLAAIGREEESVAAFRHAVALDPLFPGKAESLAHALANAEDLAGATAIVRHMQATWPDNDYTWHAHFEIAARFGDAREATTMLIDPHTTPFTPAQIAVWRSFLRARASPSRRTNDQAAAAVWNAREHRGISDATALIDFAQLGRTDLALHLALQNACPGEWRVLVPEFAGAAPR